LTNIKTGFWLRLATSGSLNDPLNDRVPARPIGKTLAKSNRYDVTDDGTLETC